MSTVNDLVTTERFGSIAILRCRGEFDLATREQLYEELSRVAMVDLEGVVVDLAGVTFMDCTGLNAILALARRCARAEVEIVLAEARPIVRNLLIALELDQLLALAPDTGDAIRLAMALVRGPAGDGARPAMSHSALLPRVPRLPRPYTPSSTER